jgi:hypothetical protein
MGVSFLTVHDPAEGDAEVDVLVQDLATGTAMDCTMLASLVGMAIGGSSKIPFVSHHSGSCVSRGKSVTDAETSGSFDRSHRRRFSAKCNS